MDANKNIMRENFSPHIPFLCLVEMKNVIAFPLLLGKHSPVLIALTQFERERENMALRLVAVLFLNGF